MLRRKRKKRTQTSTRTTQTSTTRGTQTPEIRTPRRLKQPESVRKPEKLKAVSVSRISPDNKGDAKQRQEREHKRNEWQAKRHGFHVVSHLDYVETAVQTGERLDEVIAKCGLEGASIVLINTLRRLGVGNAQQTLRAAYEDAGLRIVSGIDHETELLQARRSHTRELELMKVAVESYENWLAPITARLQGAAGKRRTTPAWWCSPEGLAVIAFVEARPHLSSRQLAKFLEAQQYLTPRGGATWFPAQVQRAREYGVSLRNEGARQVTRVHVSSV